MRSRIADAVAIDAQLVMVVVVAAVAALSTGQPTLEPVGLPGTAVDLPSGGEVRQGDAALPAPAIDGPALARKHYVEGLEVVVTLSLIREDLALDLRWSCGRWWTDVRMTDRRDSRVALERLGEDVVQTIRCR